MSQSSPAINSDESVFRPPSWGPWRAVIGTVTIYLIPQIILGVVIGLRYSDAEQLEIAQGDTITNFILQLAAAVMGLLILHALLARYGGNWRQTGLNKGFKWNYVGYALGALFAYFVLSITVYSVMLQFLPESLLNTEQDVGYQSTGDALQLALTAIGLIVIAPISEEIIFRGFLFRGLRNKLPFAVAAILSSGLFALAHFQFNVGVDVFIMGLVACWTLEKTGSLVAAILVHGLKNMIAFYILFMIN